MEAEVEDIAARLRDGFAETLLDWRDRHNGDHDGDVSRKAVGLFAPLPSRKRPLPSGVVAGEDVDWRALLLTLCRRFAGELVVEGKLLNHEEIEVSRIARTGPSSRRSVVSLSGSSVGRFIVRCQDAPMSAIGSIVAALVVQQHARLLGGWSSLLPIVSYRAGTCASLYSTANEQDISGMKSVFGFDVAQFVGPPSQRRRNVDRYASDDEDEDRRCPNAAIIKHSTFSDLRGVRRLMEANNFLPMQWTSLLTRPSQQDHTINSSMEKESAWSFVSLGTAQKKLWAKERVARGDSFRTKGRLKECVLEYDSALRLEETHGEALLRRGQVFIELRQYEDAIRDFEALYKLEPANEAAIKGLLRAKGKLGHSKHVVTASFSQWSRSASREKRPTSPRHDHSGPTDARLDNVVPVETTKKDMLTAFENDRLRKLLEEDAKARKQSRKESSRRRSDSDSSSTDNKETSDSEPDSRTKRRKRSKHKKSKKSKKSSVSRDRKKRSKKPSRRNEESDSDSDRSSRDKSASYSRSRRHKRSRSRRSQSRSRSRSRQRSSRPTSNVKQPLPAEAVSELHPILARKPHRLWN